MRILASTGNEQISTVYIAEFGTGKFVEMVQSIQTPLPIHKKWVLIVSTLFGCPVKCLMCDAGGSYQGKLSQEEILDQIDFLVKTRYPDGNIAAEKFKIQFARMGEPSFNHDVLKVLEELPTRYNAPGLLPSISTIAPTGTDSFFEELLDIKNRKYGDGRFQLQFSLHTTDESLRDRLMPVRKWDFTRISDYGREFYQKNDRKIALNFALAHAMPLEGEVLREYFDPDIFIVKITPLNPTYQALRNGLTIPINSQYEEFYCRFKDNLLAAGFEVIISIGELEENYIGSNCGQYLLRHLKTAEQIDEAYSYRIQEALKTET